MKLSPAENHSKSEKKKKKKTPRKTNNQFLTQIHAETCRSKMLIYFQSKLHVKKLYPERVCFGIESYLFFTSKN